MFCGSHSGLNRRTSKAVLELTETAPQVAHLRLLGTVIRGPVLSGYEMQYQKRNDRHNQDNNI